MGSDLLVIGYGNTLRRDDGVGPRVAETVEELRLSGVQTISCPQLTPGLADPLSQAGSAVFVDVAVDPADPVRLRRLDPSGSSKVLANATDALSRDVFGRAPDAWMLTVPAEDLAFGEQLSPTAKRGVMSAVRAIRALHGRLQERRKSRARAR